MDRPPVRVSPIGEFLIGVAERSESGRLLLGERGDRTLVIVHGELALLSGTPSDYDFAEFLVRTGRLNRLQCATLDRERKQSAEPLEFSAAFVANNLLSASELRAQRRAFWLERFARSLRSHAAQPLARNAWRPEPESQVHGAAASSQERARIVPFTLDAFARVATSADTQNIQAQLEHIWAWGDRPATAEAKQWANFGELPTQPALSLVLSKRPTCAPQLVALTRTGFGTIETAETLALSIPPLMVASFSPPPSRVSRLPHLNWSQRPPHALPDDPPPPRSQVRRLRLQLDPGSAGQEVDDIPVLALPTWPRRLGPLHDPLRDLELELDDCRDPVRRSQLFVALAGLWEQRIGSIEEAARNYREAAAAEPHNLALLVQAARACLRVGHGELALRYAAAALAECNQPEQRAELQRLRAELQERLGQREATLATLNAASEQTQRAWPEERLARLAYEQGDLQLAAAHRRAAAAAERVRSPQHALSNYALAYAWDPHNTELANDYADALAALGHPEAALAILAETARNTRAPLQQQLLRKAALRAQRHGRRDLAAELWLEALQDSAHAPEVLAQLDACLEGPETEAERAAVLESCVPTAAPADRALWLTRASAALQRIPAEADNSERYARWAEQAAEVAIYEPDATRAALRQRVRQASEPEQRMPLLRQLAAQCAQAGDSRGVVSACLEQLADTPDDPMALARMWRATSLLRDSALCVEALTLLARTRTGSARGRALAVLARQLEQLNDLDAACATAEEALAHDPSAADAALLALRHVQRYPPARALALLAHIQRLLPGFPPVLLASVEAAAASGAVEPQRRALEELIQRWPDLIEPRVQWLETWLPTTDADRIERAAEDLLAHTRAPETTRHARAAVTRLAELGASAAAAQLAERLLASRAQLDPEYAAYACELAQSSGRAPLHLQALERAASAHTGAARADYLVQISARHTAARDRAAELRALLRAAAVQEGRARALAELATRYAEAGDLQRLLTVLALRLEETHELAARRMIWFEMASATIAIAGDRPRACALIRDLLRENTADRAGLLFALSAIFALGEEPWAFQAARELATELNPGDAGVMYLWLAHKAEVTPASSELAIELAIEGAQRFPAAGELLLMAERLTLERADKPRVLSLYRTLIESACGAHGLRTLHYRAGRWLERFGAPADALEHYRRAFELAPRAGVTFAALARCARASGSFEALRAAQRTLVNGAPNERQRAALIAAAIDTSLHEQNDPAQALAWLLEAETVAPIGQLDSKLFETLQRMGSRAQTAESPKLARLLELRVQRIEQLADPDAKAAALLALARLQAVACHDAPGAQRTLETMLGAEAASPLAPEWRERARRAQTRLSVKPLPKSVAPAAPATAPARDPKLARQEDELHRRAHTGDVEALAQLVQRVGADPARTEEAFALLSQLVRTAPERTDALRELRQRSVEAGAHAQARICDQIASLFDAEYPAHARVAFSVRELASHELWQIVHGERNPGLAQLLALVWQYAQLLPQLRPASHLEALGEPWSRRQGGPLARAYDRVTSLLDRPRVALYIKEQLAQEVSALPGPPCILVVRAGIDHADRQPALEFQLARALVACEPEHALVTSLGERAASRLFTALTAAFGMAENGDAVRPADRILAAQLRAVVPKRGLDELHELLLVHAHELVYAERKRDAECSAVRAGLLVSGDVRVSLETMARTHAALNECNVETEPGFQRACGESPAFAELVRTALSLPFVGLTGLALEPQSDQVSA